MFLLLVAHLFDDRPALRVLVGKAVEVAVEMCTDLFLGLLDKAEAPFVAENAAGGADRKGACVPDGRQPADFFAEFVDALFAPGEMVEFLVGRFLQLRFDRLVPRNRRVPLVKALGGDFPGVIDPHQPGRVCFFASVEFGIDDVLGWIRSGGPARGGGNRAQGIVGAGEKAIERRQVARLHGGKYSETSGPAGILRSLLRRHHLEFGV